MNDEIPMGPDSVVVYHNLKRQAMETRKSKEKLFVLGSFASQPKPRAGIAGRVLDSLIGTRYEMKVAPVMEDALRGLEQIGCRVNRYPTDDKKRCFNIEVIVPR